jgi:hypothetical protein
MDVEVLYDGLVPEQNHLHAWSAPKRALGEDIRLCQPVSRDHLERGKDEQQ